MMHLYSAYAIVRAKKGRLAFRGGAPNFAGRQVADDISSDNSERESAFNRDTTIHLHHKADHMTHDNSRATRGT